MLRRSRGTSSGAEARRLIGSVGQTLWGKKILLLFLALVSVFLVFPSSADGEDTQSVQSTKSVAKAGPSRTEVRKQLRRINKYRAKTRKWAHKRGIHVRRAHRPAKWSNSTAYNKYRMKVWRKKAKRQKAAYLRWRNSLRPCMNNGIPRHVCAALREGSKRAGVPRSWANDPNLAFILRRESGFSCNAQNPTSTAYGLFQFLDTTWAGTGVRKTSSCVGQAHAGLIYIKNRYRTPAGAVSWWRAHHWY